MFRFLAFCLVLMSILDFSVPLLVEPGNPMTNPLYQQEIPQPSEANAMESCPKTEIPNLKDHLKEENFYLITDSGQQGRLPVLTLRLKEFNQQRRPAIVFLHSTNKCKEWVRPLLEAYASREYVAVAIDSRYDGERASSMATFQDALVSSWKKGDTMPFIFDTVWDLIKLVDYLSTREDRDPTRIGITGESLGGIPDHDKWQARVNSIKPVFEEVRVDLGKNRIDKEVVEKVWDRIAPGLASQFDVPHTVPAVSPRPLLILNGEEDRRCPIEGLHVPKSSTRKAYEEANSLHSFKLIAQPRIWHRMTSEMVKEASDWFDKFL